MYSNDEVKYRGVMSWKVLGILELNDVAAYSKKVRLSFLVAEKATKYKIGIKFGKNIFTGFRKKYKEGTKRMLFELTDDPMAINADNLFAEEYAPEADVDFDDRLFPRMLRMQNFLEEVLKIEAVNKVVLDLNIDNEVKFETMVTDVNNFCNTMLKLYEEKKDFWMPTEKIIVQKSHEIKGL